MKKILFFNLIAAGFLFINAQAPDAATLDLAGNDYAIYMFCMKDVGDYCDKYTIKTDTFLFSEDSFSIKYFEGDLWGLAGNGDYSSSGSTFKASYTAAKDISLSGISKYAFTISGFTPIDNILLGIMDISYKENKLLGDDTEESGQAYFLGIEN
jgi:hypothetical protein